MDTTVNKKVKTVKKNYVSGTGRCKEAVARVRLYATIGESQLDDQPLKKGEILINKKSLELFTTSKIARAQLSEPLRVVNALDRFAWTIVVSGGGLNGQVKAAILGMSRALVHFDEEFRSPLRKKGFLTRDARVRERRKVGTGGKARRQKQSPKR